MRTFEGVADPVVTGVETTADTMMALVYGGPGERREGTRAESDSDQQESR